MHKEDPDFGNFDFSFVTLMDNHVFVEQLYNMMPGYKNKYNYLTDEDLYWDVIKMEMGGFCV